jgi:hypothetical protein
MTFSLRSLALAIIAIAALAGGAVALTHPKSIDSTVLGSEWQCHKIAFVITTCALRTQSQAAPALDNLVTSITGRHGGMKTSLDSATLATTIRELDVTELRMVSGGFGCGLDPIEPGYRNIDNPAVQAFVDAFHNSCGGYC